MDRSALRASMARALQSTSCDGGKLLFANGQYEEASVEFEKGVTADPTDATLQANLVLCYLKCGRYAAAEKIADLALRKLNFEDKIAIRRKLQFRRALAREGLRTDGEKETEDLRQMALAFEAEKKPAEAKAAWDVYHRLVKSQRLRQLKEAARAEGWAIDSPRESGVKHQVEAIDVNSDYYRVELPAEDREFKTIRIEEPEISKLPAAVEERLRRAFSEEVTLNGPDASVRPMGEPLPEWDPEKTLELTGDEKQFEPQLQLLDEFHDRFLLKEELRQRWAKFG